MEWETLVAAALAARERAYAPYSHFRVGAALETDVGVIVGCNVENATYGATCCAERTAVFAAVAQGATAFTRIAIASDAVDFCYPCGICRQVLYEFGPHMQVAVCKADGSYRVHGLEELLPHGFGAADMDGVG